MLKLWELTPSPNNTKVRMALRLKAIEFESIPVNPRKREGVIEASGQEATPAMEDRGIVLNDSEAILQYLDANYPDTPRLFPRLKPGRRECDHFKRMLDQMVAQHWEPVFIHGLGLTEELDVQARSTFQESLARLDGELGDRSSFVEDPEMAINDLRVAEWATYAFPGDGLIERVPLFAKFQAVFGLERGSLPALERFLVPWNERLA